ncbi:MAG: hypothetical protein U0P46_02225 [Holophagaceae bacterium]
MNRPVFLSRLLGPGLALALALPLAAGGAKAPAPGGTASAAAAEARRARFRPSSTGTSSFGNPVISGAQLSPDGKWIAFLKPHKETRNVWVKKVGEPYSKGRLVTADPKRPIPGFFWSRDGKQILFVQDRDGDENFNVYAVDPAAAPAPGKDAPRPATSRPPRASGPQILSVPKADPDTIYVGLNDRDPAWHDVYKVKISTGERTLIRKNTERIAGWIFDKKANLRLALRTTEKGDTEILRVDPTRFVKVYECSVFEIRQSRGLPQGRQAGLPGDQQGAARPHGAGALRPRHRPGGEARIRSQGPRGLRRRHLLGPHGRASGHHLRG